MARGYLAVGRLIIADQAKTVAEIGVFCGRLTEFVLANSTAVERYWMIDPWQPYGGVGAGRLKKLSQEWWDDRYQQILAQFGGDPRVTILRMPSLRAATVVPDGLDCVYIDGDHSEPSVRDDISAWLPKVRIGGLLIGDDYQRPDVQRAVGEVLPNAIPMNGNRQWVYRTCASQ